MLVLFMTVEALPAAIRTLREACAEIGRDPGKPDGEHYVVTAPGPDERRSWRCSRARTYF
jgi:hypothetical protein